MEPGDLVAAGKAGFCRVGLVLERGWVPWNGTLAGTLVMQGSEQPQPLIVCQVSLTAPGAGADSESAWDTRRWEGLTVQAHERRELDFSLKMGWATGGFGSIGAVRALVMTAGGWFRWPCTLSLGVEVTPPAEFVRTAATLVDLTGFELGAWHTVMAGDGAAVILRPRDPESRLTGIDLQLFRSPERDYGELVLHSRGGRPRKIPLRLPREDDASARRILEGHLAPILSEAAELPIPSRPLARSGSLPLPAAPEGASPGELPLPARAEEVKER